MSARSPGQAGESLTQGRPCGRGQALAVQIGACGAPVEVESEKRSAVMSEGQQPVKGFELDELEVIRGSSRPVDAFSIVLVGVVVVAVVLSIYYYRTAFAGGLSHQTDDWSAFGTFIGGVFGPIVSFVTLIAILRTIWLQRELLQTQQHEFDAMQRISIQTLKSQLKQIQKADDEASVRVFEDGRNKLLTMLDRYIEGLTREIEQKRQRFDLFAQWIIDGKAPGRQDEFTKADKKIKELDQQEIGLLILYDEIIFGEFESLNEMKNHFQKAVRDIFVEKQEDDSDG